MKKNHAKQTEIKFFQLVAQNKAEELRDFIAKQKPYVNATNRCNRNALHIAAEKNATDVISILIEAKVNLNATDQDRNTPLHIAAIKGSTETLKLLLKAGAKITFNINNRSPLFTAAVKGQNDCLAILLQTNKDDSLLDKPDRTDLTALFAASGEGHLECVTLLLEYGAKILISRPGPANQNALHAAAQEGHHDILEKLCEVASSTDINTEDNAGKTPLLYALIMKKPECFDVLLKHGASIVNKNGECECLQTSIRHKSAKYLKRLLEEEKVKEYLEKTAHVEELLDLCIEEDNIECAKLLLPFAKDLIQNGTLLHNATAKNAKNCLTSFFDEKMPIINDQDNNNLVHVSALNGSNDCLSLLIRNNKVNINEQNVKGQTPLHLAAQNNHTKCFEKLLYAKAQILLDKEGDTPIHTLIINNGNLSFLVPFVKKGFDINVKNAAGDPGLFIALRLEKQSAINFLLQSNNFNLDAINHRGDTALHIAALKGDIESTNKLIQNGAKVIANNKGLSPLNIAENIGHEGCAAAIKAADVSLEERFPELFETTKTKQGKQNQANRNKKNNIKKGKKKGKKKKKNNARNTQYHEKKTNASEPKLEHTTPPMPELKDNNTEERNSQDHSKEEKTIEETEGTFTLVTHKKKKRKPRTQRRKSNNRNLTMPTTNSHSQNVIRATTEPVQKPVPPVTYQATIPTPSRPISNLNAQHRWAPQNTSTSPYYTFFQPTQIRKPTIQSYTRKSNQHQHQQHINKPKTPEDYGLTIIPQHKHKIKKEDIPETILRIRDVLCTKNYKTFITGRFVPNKMLAIDKINECSLVTNMPLQEVSQIIRNDLKIYCEMLEDTKCIRILPYDNLPQIDITMLPKEDNHTEIYSLVEKYIINSALTITSLFLDLDSFAVICTQQAMCDIENKMLRAINDPTETLKNDPPVILYALYYNLSQGFKIEEELNDTILASTQLLKEVLLSTRFELLCNILNDVSSNDFANALSTLEQYECIKHSILTEEELHQQQAKQCYDEFNEEYKLKMFKAAKRGNFEELNTLVKNNGATKHINDTINTQTILDLALLNLDLCQKEQREDHVKCAVHLLLLGGRTTKPPVTTNDTAKETPLPHKNGFSMR